jgi:hypothetical protein
MIIHQHKEMVLRLGKPGAAILATLTPEDCNLVHMGGCLMGEAAELYEACNEISCTKNDIIEELGDFEFYMVACRAAIGIERGTADWVYGQLESKQVAAVGPHLIRLMVLGGNFWDIVKRVTVYRKPIEQARAEGILREMELCLHCLYSYYDLRMEDILQANWTKLADKDKGRYREGAYSDEAAQARRDKNTHGSSDIPLSAGGYGA